MTFDERWEAFLEATKDRQPWVGPLYEGTDLYAEWLKLQEYDDPLKLGNNNE